MMLFILTALLFNDVVCYISDLSDNPLHFTSFRVEFSNLLHTEKTTMKMIN